MATVTVTPRKTFTSGEVVTPAKLSDAANPTAAISLIVDADIDAAAAIAKSKLALTGAITNADIDATAAIAASKLNLAGAIGPTQLASNAVETATIANSAVTLSKLSLPSNFPIQVVQAVKTDVQTVDTGVSDWVDVSGLSVTLTRAIASASGKVRVQASIACSSNDAASPIAFRIVRDGTAIGLGDAAGSRIQVTATGGYGGAHAIPSYSIDFVDTAPGSSSTVTYKIQARIYSVVLAYINRSNSDTNAGDYSHRAISTMTLTELSP